MPTDGCLYNPDWKQAQARREEYRQRLIAKGVADGSRKMMKLMGMKRF